MRTEYYISSAAVVALIGLVTNDTVTQLKTQSSRDIIVDSPSEVCTIYCIRNQEKQLQKIESNDRDIYTESKGGARGIFCARE